MDGHLARWTPTLYIIWNRQKNKTKKLKSIHMLLTYIFRAQKMHFFRFACRIAIKFVLTLFHQNKKSNFPFFDAKFYKTKENHLNARFLLQFFFQNHQHRMNERKERNYINDFSVRSTVVLFMKYYKYFFCLVEHEQYGFGFLYLFFENAMKDMKQLSNIVKKAFIVYNQIDCIYHEWV